MKLLKTVMKYVADFFELYLPCTTFCVMFIAFIMQIVSRYVFNNPISWAFETTTFCFVWTVLFSALYAKRTGSHVKFSIIYDMLSKNTQLWIRLIGNFLIVITFVAAVYPAWDYIMFMNYKKSTILNIPYSVLYFPFIIFLIGMIIRFSTDIVNDLKVLKNRNN